MIVEKFDKCSKAEIAEFIETLQQSVALHTDLMNDTSDGDPQDPDVISKCKEIIRAANVELGCIEVYIKHKES